MTVSVNTKHKFTNTTFTCHRSATLHGLKTRENPPTHTHTHTSLLLSPYTSTPDGFPDCIEADSAAYHHCEITHTANGVADWKQVTHLPNECVASFNTASHNCHRLSIKFKYWHVYMITKNPCSSVLLEDFACVVIRPYTRWSCFSRAAEGAVGLSLSPLQFSHFETIRGS